LGIDAWWQDATEPENDDLAGRRVNKGKWSGEKVRNVYPMLVNKTVYEGLLTDRPEQRPMILTRSGFAGIQRYGTALWSGDVGNDWETLRRQIAGGLGMQAAGVPWWTYDAGGFFRPGNQYKDKAYIERLLRWVQTSVYLPLMRVHGYQSNTEPWCYGDEAKSIIAKSLEERYRLLPYIYSHAAEVSASGYTLMRPLVFDFSTDVEALRQLHEYMFGSALLISPITQPGVTSWKTYLPKNAAGWYDYRTGKHYSGGKYVTTTVDKTFIPVFARGGSIVPVGAPRQYAAQTTAEPLELRIYPGADAQFTLYEDDGVSQSYRNGECSRIAFSWDDDRRTLTIARRQGSYDGMQKRITLNVTLPDGTSKSVVYKGKKITCKF
jgi:alpha-D-xyloside xylohydrolase